MSSQVFRGNRPGFLTNWSLTLAGALYVGGMAAHFVLLRGLDDGRSWLLLTMLAVWTCDSLAYAVGSRWGSTKLAPEVSPNKTWEGAVAGGLGTVLLVMLLGSRWLRVAPAPPV